MRSVLCLLDAACILITRVCRREKKRSVDSVSTKCHVTMATGDATLFVKGDRNRGLFTTSVMAGSITTVKKCGDLNPHNKPNSPSDFVHHGQSLGY